jgi:uncharacterized protein DUF1552
MTVSRRVILRAGGALLALPLLESLGPKSAQAAPAEPPFAIFFRQACGVASEQTTSELGPEPERFWPRTFGQLTLDSLHERAVGELADHAAHLLVLKGVNMYDFNYGDGHARGALQGLTAQGPVQENQGGSSEANGESIDHLIGRTLNPRGRDSLFLYAGPPDGWLGGACISYRGPGDRRAAIRHPLQAYELMTGGAQRLPSAELALVQRRQRSVNDLVREQMQGLLARPRLSQADRRRLELHFAAVRDFERAAQRLSEDEERALRDGGSLLSSTSGEDIVRLVHLHMDVAALAVASGYTRAVALQVGNGNDGSTRYLDPTTGQRMENYHYVSHRRRSHDASGSIIEGADRLHHQVDRYFAQMFRHLLDRLSEYPSTGGSSLLERGVSVWYNDHSDGPAHGYASCPFVLAGSAGGFFKQNEYLKLMHGTANHGRLLATIASAVGVQGPGGGPLDAFGDARLPTGLVREVMAQG